jgi:4-hydroxybenzoate polyprenyltransferase
MNGKVLWNIPIMVLSATVIRVFLEFFSNPNPLGVISPWYGFLQYFVFFLAMTLGVGIIIGKLVQESFTKWIFITARALPIIFLAPIFDLIISHGQGICMAYSGSSGSRIITDFFTFFGTFNHCGITIGMRIEMIIILLGIGWIIWKKTHAFRKTIAGILVSYFFFFINAIIPAIVGIHFVSKLPILDFVMLVSAIHFLTIVTFLLVIWFQENKNSFCSWMQNTRYERILYYLCIMALGVMMAHSFGQERALRFQMITICIALVSFIAHCWAAAIWNDLADQDIDAISNETRPLVRGTIPLDNYKNLGLIFFIVAMVGSLIVGYSFFFFLFGSQIIYAVYSIRGTRIKTHFVSSSLLIGCVGVFVFFAGYFLLSSSLSILTVPFQMILVLFVTLAILSNGKDFKDVKGDRVHDIKTLPVLYGSRRAGKILAITIAVWTSILAFVFKNPYIVLFSIPWLVLQFGIRKRVPEYILFLIVFFEMIFIFFMIQ